MSSKDKSDKTKSKSRPKPEDGIKHADKSSKPTEPTKDKSSSSKKSDKPKSPRKTETKDPGSPRKTDKSKTSDKKSSKTSSKTQPVKPEEKKSSPRSDKKSDKKSSPKTESVKPEETKKKFSSKTAEVPGDEPKPKKPSSGSSKKSSKSGSSKSGKSGSSKSSKSSKPKEAPVAAVADTLAGFLSGLGLDGDADLYADLLADSGYKTRDDLEALDERLEEELFDAGVANKSDRIKIFLAIFPPPASDDEGGGSYNDSIDDYLNEKSYSGSLDSRSDPENDALEAQLNEMAALLQHLEEEASKKGPAKKAGGPNKTIKSSSRWDKAAFQRAYNYLEGGNTHQFKLSIDSIDVNMQDPETLNTLLHWTVAFNNPTACQALLDKGAKQYPNVDGKAPVELALNAFNSDSSFFNIRDILGYHAQENLRKTGSIYAVD